MAPRLHPVCLLLVLLAVAAVPTDFLQRFDEVAALIEQEELSAMDMARGTYAAARLFSVGEAGLPVVGPRFEQARSRGEACVGGLYLSVHGRSQHLMAIRREVETDRRKRIWTREVVGTETAFFAHLESGQRWIPFLRVLPSVGGCREVAHLLMASPDALTRRAGLYWGYWTGDEAYRRRVRQLADRDANAETRSIATRLSRVLEQRAAREARPAAP